MDTGIYAAVSAQVSAERQMESIASNLANLQTTGYKRSGAATEAFDEVLRGRMHRQVQTRMTTDFAQGQLQLDGGVTDLALSGPGFFAVETPRGEAYTRNGRFVIDDGGVLQTLEGYPVAWEGGHGAVDPRGAPISVDATGTILQGDEPLGRLAIRNFADPAALELDRYAYRHPRPGAVEVPHQAEVVQGALERANVDPLVEMTQMILVQRRFEHAARIMSQLDDTYRRLNQAHN